MKFTFEMYREVTESTTVEAESQQKAEELVKKDKCKWNVVDDYCDDDFYLVNEEK